MYKSIKLLVYHHELFFLSSKQFRFYSTKFNENFKIDDSHEKLVRVAIIGVPNAGKSTFINNLINHRVCPTSNKVHTTRDWSKAICTRQNSQIILYDTPGLVTAKDIKKHQLESTFSSSWRHSIQHSDIIAVLHDISNNWTRNELHPTVLNCLSSYPTVPSFLVLNKVDLLKSKRILLDIVKNLTNNKINLKNKYSTKTEITKVNISKDSVQKQEKMVGWSNFSEVFMVSSVTGDGLDKVMDFLVTQSKPKPWMHKSNEFTDQTPERLIVNSVRARLLDYLPQEIPYLLISEMEYFSNENGQIYASVQVTCPSNRIEKLVCGESNGKLRQITERISSDLVETFGVPISLTISTIVKKKE